MKVFTRIMAVSFVIWMTPAVASDFYMNIAGAQTIIDTDAGEVKPFIGALKLGYQLTDNFGLEVQYGAGFDSDELNDQEYKVDSLGAAFIRISSSGSYSDVRLYLLVGYSQAELKIDDITPIDNGKYDGFAYGIGAEEFLKSAKNLAFAAEYVRYYDRDTVTIDAITLGFRYRF
ncbi:outer membrane beta-barrel protein [Kaarinaea lacus]